MQNNLVKIENETIVTSSRSVAEHFGKRHDKLIHEINRMYSDYCAGEGMPKMVETPMFFKTTYVHEQNGQTYPMYLMNRDGFSLLVMGFTGKKALEWKLKYINAFNSMEKQLAELSKPSYQIDDPIARARKWADEQESLRKQINAKTEQIAKLEPKAAYADTLAGCEGSMLIRDAAKVLNIPHFGQQAFFSFLRDNRYIIPGTREPYQRYIDAGYFSVKTSYYETRTGERIMTHTPLITPRGLAYFARKINGMRQHE